MTKRARVEWGTLVMREPNPADVERYADALALAYNHPRNAPLLGHEDEIGRDEVIEHYADLAEDEGRAFMLFNGDDLVGDGDLRGICDRAAEIAFLIADPGEQGKGLGTKLALFLTTFGFRALDLDAIYGSVVPHNVASRRVFEKLGFWLDDSPRARSFAEVPDDLVFAMDRATFDRLHGETVAGIVIVTGGSAA
jgi:RimJ/RimL family protein N-acetyltransferase